MQGDQGGWTPAPGAHSLEGGKQEPMGPTLQISILELLIHTTNGTKCLLARL